MALEIQLVASGPNQQAKAGLLKQLRERRMTLFAGAGVAIPAGFPSWPRLLGDLESLCDEAGHGFRRNPEAVRTDPIGYADAIKDHIRNCKGNLGRYETFMSDRFRKDPQLQPFHRDLVSLPLRGFLTTNYDLTLEAALSRVEREPLEKSVVIDLHPGLYARDFLQSLTSDHPGRLVAHIHGYYRQPESIVLSRTDYTRAYGLDRPEKAPQLPRFLNAVLDTGSLVFVGFSFEDQQFDAVLRAAVDGYGTWGMKNHYALIPTTRDTWPKDEERSREYRDEFGIETVFYECIDGSHQQLYDTISGFCSELGLGKGSAVVEFNSRMIEGMQG